VVQLLFLADKVKREENEQRRSLVIGKRDSVEVVGAIVNGKLVNSRLRRDYNEQPPSLAAGVTAYSFPAFARDEGRQAQCSHRIRPVVLPNSIDDQARQSNPSHVPA
jgi:hypothetical protein